MRQIFFCATALLLSLSEGRAQRQPFTAVNDIFGARAFIENRGQFDLQLPQGEKIYYALDNGDEKILFTNKGLVYQLAKNFSLNEEERERMERGEVIRFKQAKLLHVKMNWQNANANIEVTGSEKTGHYFSYGAARHLSYGYKKLTYKNVYNKIDIEYIIPTDKLHGIKYSLILHPGANIEDVKIAYTGDVEKIRLNRDGEVVVSTQLEDITEHTPSSFYSDKQPVVSSFKLSNNVISYNLPDNYNRSKTLIVDPWVTTITGIPSNNYGYDVDYDDAGNVFIYGGTPPAKIAKYNASGTLLWTFQGTVTLPVWNGSPTGTYIGNFVVMKSNGRVYTGQGFNSSGATIIRLDVNGVYDNLMTPTFSSWKEVWDMAYHCSTGNIYGMGGSTSSNQSAGIVNQTTGTLTPVAFCTVANTSAGYDVVSHAIDDAGEFFWIYAGPPGINNMMARINSAFTSSVWLQPSTFNVMVESANKNAYVGGPGAYSSNGFNCLGVNQNFLFYYDGLNLAAYNKTNGNIVASTTIPGLTLMAQGGIAVDDCNVLYLGGNGSILSYSFNGTSFNALTPIPLSISNPNQYVYDIKMDKLNKVLYVCGSGFVGTWNASNSTACSPLSILCYNPLGVDYLICGGSAITLTPVNALNLSNPTFSVNPGNLSNSTGTFVIYPGGSTNYTTYVIGTTSTNAVVTLTSSASVTVFPQPVSAPTTTQSTCTNTFNAFNLNLTFNPASTPGYSIAWSPAVPYGINSSTQTSSSADANGAIAPGVYTATITAQGGCSTIKTFTIDPTPAPAVFNIIPGGPYVISCLQPVLNLTYTPSSFNYTTNNNLYAPISGPFPVFTSTNYLGTHTVTAEHPQSGCVSTKTFVINQSTATPVAVITPSFQNITCSLSSITNVTATASPTVNIEHQWISPVGTTLTANSATAIFLPGSPGTYTHCIVNLANGCKSCKNFTVASNDGFPVFTVQSPQNFTLGCTTKSVATINIVGGNTSPVPGGAVSYTILGPPTGQTLPGGILSNLSTYQVSTPGTWTIVTRDNSSSCDSKAYVSVTQFTMGPSIDSVIVPRNILTCDFPKVDLEGISNTPNVNYVWTFPGNPNSLAGSSITVNSNPAAPNTSVVANYTLTITDNSSTCKSTTVIPVLQNLFPPKPLITGGNQLTCVTESIVLTNSSATGIPPGFFNPVLPVVGYLWIGPTPQLPLQVSSTYVAYLPGTYTLIAVDRNNGCSAIATKTIGDFREYPVVNKPNTPPPFVLDCGNTGVKISPIITSTGSLTYTWIAVAGANVSGQNTGTLTTNASGRYEVLIRNEMSGCESKGFLEVIDGSLKADFAPDRLTGFAPMEVTFTNNSSSSTGNSGVVSIWSFGNGSTLTTTSASLQPKITYHQPGTYSVTMYSTKGLCEDTVVKFIDVESPSEMNIPNIFTPNGDGVNDVFFLKTTNISSLNISIYDRWGHMIYELTTEKGNIAWDGKNQKGKDAPDGVYFYVLNALGTDGTKYEKKGNITLAR